MGGNYEAYSFKDFKDTFSGFLKIPQALGRNVFNKEKLGFPVWLVARWANLTN